MGLFTGCDLHSSSTYVGIIEPLVREKDASLPRGVARRFDSEARAYYNRKLRGTNASIAHSALAHKLARAEYYIMRDRIPFKTEKAFA